MKCRCTPGSHLRELAIHDEDKAGAPRCIVWMVACDDCDEAREHHSARESSTDAKGKDRKPGRPITRLSAMLDELRRASGSMRELQWYVDPTWEQRRTAAEVAALDKKRRAA